MKKLIIFIAAAVAAILLTACGGDDIDITINKVTSSDDSSQTTVSETVSEDVSSEAPASSQETSSEPVSSQPEEQSDLPADVLSVATYAAGYFFPDSAESGFTCYDNGIETVGGYECYVVEVFDSTNTFLATYACSVEYDNIYFVYDTDSGKYRIMTIGNDIVLGDFADSLVSHGVYTNEPAGYTFAYDGDPEVRTDYSTTVFETPLWLLAIEGEVATASLDFSDASVREAQEDTVMREMAERLGLELDWALESDSVNIGGNTFVRRPFFATYNGTVNVEIGTVYYGYAPNGMFYKLVAFSIGESNSVSELLEGITFTDRKADGIVRDDRTQSREPTRPDGGLENGETDDTSSESEYNDRPWGW